MNEPELSKATAKESKETAFLKRILPDMGYRWAGFRKPRRQVMRRVYRRMQELWISRLEDYHAYLDTHAVEWQWLDRMCNITISRFFRDRQLWDELQSNIIPELLLSGNERLRIWSAGCCNGEEPYSIAIITDRLVRQYANPPQIRILATDRDPALLQRAREGRFPPGALKEAEDVTKRDYFTPTPDSDDEFLISSSLSEYLTFQQQDLRTFLPVGPFDLIFCRNLAFTYFDKNSQISLLQSLARLLTPHGYLIVGAHEHLPEAPGVVVEEIKPMIYKCFPRG